MTLTWSGVRPAHRMISSSYQTNVTAQTNGPRTLGLEIMSVDIAVI